MSESAFFQWYDYLIFTSMLVLSLSIGVFYGCFGSKQDEPDAYMYGNKRMNMVTVAVSLIASHVSGSTLLILPSDIYAYGASFWLTCLMIPFVATVVNYVYLPVFHNLEIKSVYEYLEKRFDSTTRNLASAIYILEAIITLSVVIYLPALAFSTATGFDVNLTAFLLLIICIFYTLVGGLKTVVWTDNVQFGFTVLFFLIVCTKCIISLGGLSNIWKTSYKAERLDVFDFDLDPTLRNSFWTCVVGLGFFISLSQSAIHPTYVLKYVSIRSLREAKKAVWMMAGGALFVTTSACLLGLIIYTKYANCNPVTSGRIKQHDQIVPYFVMDIASDIPTIPGFFLAGIVGAALSVLSAGLNCVATTIYSDFVSSWFDQYSDRVSETACIKGLVLLIGVLCTILMYIFEYVGSFLNVIMSVTGIVNGPLLGMFTLGMLFPKASKRGVFWGTLTGFGCTFILALVGGVYLVQQIVVHPTKPFSIAGCHNTTILDNTTARVPLTIAPTSPYPADEPIFLFRISFYYYAAIGSLITVIVGLILSYTYMAEEPCTDKKLISPVVHCFMKDDKRTVSQEMISISMKSLTDGNKNL